MIEIELKYSVADMDQLVAHLQRLNASRVSKLQQEDCYYNHQLDDFKKKDIAFRIRQSDSQYLLTYKGPNLDAEAKIREEVEMPLVDAAAAEMLPQILTGVGFYAVASVHKDRETWHLNYKNTAVEVCVDQVRDLGAFAELEVLANDESEVPAVKQTLLSLATELEVSEPILTSYLDLLMSKP